MRKPIWKRMIWITVLAVTVSLVGTTLASEYSNNEVWGQRDRGWMRCPETHWGAWWQDVELTILEGTLTQINLDFPFPELVVSDSEGNEVRVVLHPARFFSPDDFTVGESVALSGVYRAVYGTEVFFAFPDWADSEKEFSPQTRRRMWKSEFEPGNEEQRQRGMKQNEGFRRGR